MTPAVPPARLPSDPVRGRRSGVDLRRADLSVRISLPDDAGPQHLVPNLLIAGVTHSGAADLAEALGRHPEVKLPSPRRVDHYTVMRYGQPLEAALADYDRYFSTWGGQRYRLESSPVYFDGGATLVDAVARDLQGARVVLLLRDPAERLWTSYADKVARGRLPQAMTYETFVDRCLALRDSGTDRFEGNRHFRTLSSGFYVEYLDPWLEAFGRCARIVFAEDLDATPSATVDGLLRWLGLDPSLVPYPEHDEPETVNGVLEYFEPASARRLWSALPVGRRSPQTPSLVRRVTRAVVPRQADRVRARVEALYAGANHDLGDLLRDRGHTDLPAWLD